MNEYKSKDGNIGLGNSRHWATGILYPFRRPWRVLGVVVGAFCLAYVFVSLKGN